MTGRTSCKGAACHTVGTADLVRTPRASRLPRLPILASKIVKFGTLVLLMATATSISLAQESDDCGCPLPDPDLIEPVEAGPGDCDPVPTGAPAPDYRMLDVAQPQGRAPDFRVPPNPDAAFGEQKSAAEPGQLAPDNLYDRLVIPDEQAFNSVFGVASTGINWATERVVVVEEFRTYRFDNLESTVHLAGVYLTESSIVIYQTSNHYGPCQGIAQDPSWFSFESTYLALVLPKAPARIDYYWCSVGGCPPDIP